MIWKKIGVLAAAAILAAAAAGCDQQALAPSASSAPTSVSREAPQPEASVATPIPSFEAASFDAPQIDIEVVSPVPVFTATPGPSQSFMYDSTDIEVRYYDMAQQKEMSTTVPVENQDDPEAVIKAVTETLSSLTGSGQVSIAGYTYSDGNLFLDFDPSIYSIGMDSGTEHELLEAIADTYLINVQGIRAVYYTVDGLPYASEHTQLNANEAYKTLLG